jgi:hypothetical protein
LTDYKRMVSYMYQYEQGVKKKNVGYARIEIRNGQCKITLHMQLLGQLDSIFPTYLIARSNQETELIYLGDSVLKNQVLESRLSADESNVCDSGYRFADVGGILLFLNDEVFYATEWDDKPIIVDEIIHALKPKSKKTKLEEAAWKDTIKKAMEYADQKVAFGEDDRQRQAEDGEFGSNEGITKPSESGETEIIVPELGKIENTIPEIEEIEEAEEVKEFEGIEEIQEIEGIEDIEVIEGIKDIKDTKGIKGIKNIKDINDINDIKDIKDVKGIKEIEESKGQILKVGEFDDHISESKETESRVPKSEEPKGQVTKAEGLKDPIQESQEPKSQMPENKESMGEIPKVEVEGSKNPISESNETESRNVNENEAEEKPEHPVAVRFFERYPRIYPFEDNEIIRCVKIEPKDIGYFPKEIWGLSNNSFLLHGYYSYRHLIFAKIKDRYGSRYIIGVPGTYYRKEQFMARMFGFENFKSAVKREIRQGDFGYWYLTVAF